MHLHTTSEFHTETSYFLFAGVYTILSICQCTYDCHAVNLPERSSNRVGLPGQVRNSSTYRKRKIHFHFVWKRSIFV